MREVRERIYRLLHPRQVVLIVTRNEKINVMALSWITPLEENILAISIDKENYTYKLIKKTKEFTVNIPTKNLMKEVWKAGTKSGYDVDKTKILKLSFENGIKSKTPHIKECVAWLECKVLKEIEIEDHSLFIAKIVYAKANEKFDKIWKEGSEILFHVGKNLFCTTSKYFKI